MSLQNLLKIGQLKAHPPDAAEGSIRGAQARVIGFDDPAGDDWLAVNQYSVVENKRSRRPDVGVKFVFTRVSEPMP